MNGPRWIKQWIADLALLNEQFRNDDGSVDFEALGREEYMFRTALITQKLEKSERARETFMTAKAAYDASSENGKKGGRPRKNQDTTADGDTRDGSLNESDGRDAVDLESSTSANISVNDGCSRQNRRTGAEPRGVSHSAPVRLPSYDEFTRFVDQQGLDYTDAREWWEMTMVDRDGKDRDGKPIANWKGALKRFCSTKTANRRSA